MSYTQRTYTNHPMTIKQHLEQLPEPYNWLALEEADKKQLSKKVANKHKTSSVLHWHMVCFSSPENFDMWYCLYLNLKHLGK